MRAKLIKVEIFEENLYQNQRYLGRMLASKTGQFLWGERYLLSAAHNLQVTFSEWVIIIQLTMQQQATKPQNLFKSPSNFKQKAADEKSLISLIKKCQNIISVFADKDIKPNFSIEKDSRGSLEVLSNLIEVVFQLVTKYAENMDQFNRIEKMLQKQQNLNRTLIKKELEYQEEHKMLVEELCGQRNKCAKLNQHISRLNDEAKDKDLTILHVKNELKACQKEKKILDDNKGNMNDEPQFKNSFLKDMNSQKIPNVLKLGHKRRNSEDVNRKTNRNEVKKKQKIKYKDTKAT